MTARRAKNAPPIASAEGCTVAYLRVSTNEQAESGAGLAAQRASIVAYARHAALSVDRWLVDEGVSGSIAPEDRPALAEALRMLGKGRGMLLVAKGDRIARKTADLLALRDLAEKQRWTLVAADGSIDWTTAHGRAMSTVMGAFAELERDLIRTRTREGLQARKAAGQRLGAPVKLPSQVRTQIKTERDLGRTLAAIASQLNDEQVPTARNGSRWFPSTVRAVLTSLDLDEEARRARAQQLAKHLAPTFPKKG